MTIEDLIWDQVEPHVYIAQEDYFAGWEIEAVSADDGTLAWAVMTKGPEFHFTSFGEVKHPITVRMIKSRLHPLIERYGFARTRTPKEDARQRRFNDMIGFMVEGEDEFFVTYRIEKVGRPACRS